MLALAFPAPDIHYAAWIALVPLFIAVKGRTLKEGFWLGGITGIVYFFGTVYWVTNSVHFYGHIPLIPATGITLLLCVYLALYVALFGAAIIHLRSAYPALFVLGAPALWTTLELARTYLFSGFPWSVLGYSQYSVLPIIQIADITGVYGISFLIVLVNAGIAEFLIDRKRFIGLIVAVVALVLTLGYGLFRLQTPDNAKSVTISVVQGNIEQDKKWDPTYQAETLSIYKKLTVSAVKNSPHLVIIPGRRPPHRFISPERGKPTAYCPRTLPIL